MFLCMIPFHFLYLIMDCVIYKFEVLLILFDIAFIWFNYYNYMTLNKLFIFIHLPLLAVFDLCAITHIQRALETGESNVIWWYFIQFYFLTPAFLVFTGIKLVNHIKKQEELKDKKLNKSLGGKLEVKGKQIGL